MNGRLIVFEGIDGTGKSTQLERLALLLESAGHEVVRTSEPYPRSPAGQRIREMAKSGVPVALETELGWFLEQRRDHVRELIVPALERGAIVLSDRYFLSTVAYQGARGLDWAALLREQEAEGFPPPDLAVLFDLDAGEALSRVTGRGETAEPVFEERRFLERVREIYLAIDRPYLTTIDAGAPEAEVAGAIARLVRARLDLP